MEKYTVNLRYFVGDLLEDIEEHDLQTIAKAHGVEISHETIDNRILEGGLMKEETLGRAIEEITQDIITVTTSEEGKFRSVVKAIYEKYRSPRTPYGFWGSSEDGDKLAREIADETGGGW